MTVPSLWQPPALPIAGHLLHREEGMISRSTLQIGRGDRDHACRRESDESHDGGTWPEGDTLLCHTRSLDANGVRTLATITATTGLATWFDRVVPFWVECIPFDRELAHLSLAYPDARLVGALVERAFDLEAGFGGGAADQLDHCGPALQRLSPPVLRDVAEHPVLNLVPLRGARRIVVDVERETRRIGELL